MTDYKTAYSNDKNINTLDRGSYTDCGDGTPAKQVKVCSSAADPVSISADKDNPVAVNQVPVINVDFLQSNITVTSTPIEVKVGAVRLDCRKSIRIYNGSGKEIFWGPAGVTSTTGEPLRNRQSVTIAAGPDLAVFLVAAGPPDANDVIIMEFS